MATSTVRNGASSVRSNAQVTGGVDDGDGSRDADGTGRSERRVDEGDCGSRLIEAVAIDLVVGFSSLGHNPFGF
ncbi:hypothetical protein P4M26_31695 [Pseudomonas aeruginosa]|nr:hypothetical protein [Pseudomonas aeruginosa]